MNAKQFVRMTAAGLILGLVMGLLAAGQVVVMRMGGENPYDFPHAIIMQTPFWVFWAPIFPVILMLTRRFPLERGSFRKNIPLHIAAAFFVSLFHIGVILCLMHAINHGYPTNHSYWVHFQTGAQSRLWVHVFGYLGLLGIALVSDYYRKYRDRELLASQLTAQLSQAKLHALRMQLNPHFLFNALNSIAMLTRRNDSSRAVTMIAGLGDLLRYVLEDSPADEVTLREELGFLSRYLEIERVRFQDRLQIRLDVAEEAMDAFMPNLLLQPIVENAIRHGIARKVNQGSIEIAGRKLGDRLILQVRDDGPGLSGPGGGGGVGLRNTRQRLEQLYGDQFSFELRNADGGGTVVSISLPFHTHPLNAEVSAA